MDFIDNHEFSCLPAQKRVGVRQPSLVDGSLQVEIDGLGVPIRSDLFGESCLADLTRSEQHDRWHMPEPVLDVWPNASRDGLHARNLNA
jgi:hypothetical protein